MALESPSVDPYAEMIDSVSRVLAYEYGVDREDIASEVWVWVLDHPEQAEKLAENGGLLRHRLTSVGRRYAAKERAQAYGYDPSDIINYSTRVIRELLPDVFDHEDWQSGEVSYDSMPKAKKLVNAGMDRVAMLIDIKIAMEKLPDEAYNAIVWVYKYSYTMEQLAAELEITQDAAQKRVQRAVNKIQRLLTEVRPMEKPQRRACLSNAAARAIQSGHWDGG